MAPKRTNNAGSRSSNTHDSHSSGPESQDVDTTHSQEQAVTELQEAFKAKNTAAKRRHRDREKANDLAHRNRVKEWQDAAHLILSEHEEAISIIERPKIERLIRLRRTKREMQREMNVKVAAMEKLYKVAMQRLNVVLEQRLHDLAAPPAVGVGATDGKDVSK